MTLKQGKNHHTYQVQSINIELELELPAWRLLALQRVRRSRF